MGRSNSRTTSSSKKKRAPKGSGSFPCLVKGCTAKLTRAADVLRHQQIHDPETLNNNRCFLCAKYSTRQPCNLKSHLLKHNNQAAAPDSTVTPIEGDVKPDCMQEATMFADKERPHVKFGEDFVDKDELKNMVREAKIAAEDHATPEETTMKTSRIHPPPYPEHFHNHLPHSPKSTSVVHQTIAGASVNCSPFTHPPQLPVLLRDKSPTWLPPPPKVQRRLQPSPPPAHYLGPAFAAPATTPRALPQPPSFQGMGAGISAAMPRAHAQEHIYYAPAPTYPYPTCQYPSYSVYQESGAFDYAHETFPSSFEGNSALMASSVSGTNYMPFAYTNPAPQNASTYQAPPPVYPEYHISTSHEPYHSNQTLSIPVMSDYYYSARHVSYYCS